MNSNVQVGKGFLDKLEQVSENPDLKQEMEAEVASTNSNQVWEIYYFKLHYFDVVFLRLVIIVRFQSDI